MIGSPGSLIYFSVFLPILDRPRKQKNSDDIPSPGFVLFIDIADPLLLEKLIKIEDLVDIELEERV